MNKLSVVINVHNEADNLPKVIKSVKDLADEIVVIDLESTDDTIEIGKKLGAKVYSYKNLGFVEPSRNFGISKATGDWVLILDADEEVGDDLRVEIDKVIKNPKADYYRLPRKNIIFGKWIKTARWWPDYNIRLFKKGTVSWNEVIHSVPMTQGLGVDLPEKEELAIIHNNYTDIDSYFEKMLRYTKAQAKNLLDNDYKFVWSDLITKPVNEFLSRYFAGKGYKEGVHGLVISLLQAFSELVLYVRVWNYEEINIKDSEINSEFNKNIHDLKWWIRKEFSWLSRVLHS